MKIATLTFQRHNNIGAMLQCYALQHTIMKYGYDNEIIDYICDAADRPFGYKSLKVKGLKKYITSCIGVISRLPKKNAFNEFRCNYLKMTSKVNTKNVATLGEMYDGYIVGSDNVWNSSLTGLDKNYFLDFVREDYKKASYAASLGMGTVPQNEQEAFKKYISRFSIITLRERSAAENIKELTGRDVADTCDPTFFLTASEWDTLAIEPKTKGKYILVYQMSPSYSFVKFADKVAKTKGFPIVYVPFPYGFCKCSMKPHIGPCEWLGYIKHAEYVITDSFHGCVFSLIYERNLIIKISKLGDRIKDLTERLGASERIVDTVEQAVSLPDMDYSDIRNRISSYKNDGEATLKAILHHFAEINRQG